MLEDYLIIHKSILPEYYEKVVETRRLLETGQVKEVSQAVKLTGISRSTYYKFKNYILIPSEMEAGRKAVITMLLSHETGVLSSVLSRISEAGGSVFTITQSIPIRGVASLTVSLDVSAMKCSLEELLAEMSAAPGVENPRIFAVE